MAAGLLFAACEAGPVGEHGDKPSIDDVAQASGGDTQNRSRYIVVVNPKVVLPRDAARIAVQQHGGTLVHVYEAALKGFAVELAPTAVGAVSAMTGVLRVEPDATVKPLAVQNSAPWQLDRLDQVARFPDNDQFAYCTTGAGVTAYVLDTGIRATHQEFQGRAQSVWDVAGGAGGDCHGHGTAIASLLGGATYGSAKDVAIRSLRISNDCGVGVAQVSDMLAAINWVTANAVHPAVANFSYGGGPGGSTSLVAQAITASSATGITWTVAAGNSWQDACTVQGAASPAALIVGASTDRDELWRGMTGGALYGSNWGACVDIFAPGHDVTHASSTSDTAIAVGSGTSASAPLVAGLAARYLEGNPTASAATVFAAITGGGTPLTLQMMGAPTSTVNLLTHLSDCQTSVCGDAWCDATETPQTCPADCGTPGCGDGVCDYFGGETNSTCPADCTAVCGNGLCEPDGSWFGETYWTCPQDCPFFWCGDGLCMGSETPTTCALDCAFPTCGNGFCETGETYASCPLDCPAPACGNGTCEINEDPTSCPADCPLSTIYFTGGSAIVGGSTVLYNDVRSATNVTSWSTLSPSGAAGVWSGRVNHGLLYYQGALWVMGGAAAMGPGNWVGDVWRSTNGVTWTLISSSAPYVGTWGARAAVFNGRMVVIGGMLTAAGVRPSKAWSTTDGTTWTTVNLPFNERAMAAVATAGGSIYVIGGVDSVSGSGTNDVWRSFDGTTFTQVTTSLPQLSDSKLLAYQGKLFLLGGTVWTGTGGVGTTDVRVSTDGGLTWQNLGANLPLGAHHFGIADAVVASNKMWLFGSGSVANKAWWSTDGVTWTLATSALPWTGRTSFRVVAAP